MTHLFYQSPAQKLHSERRLIAAALEDLHFWASRVPADHFYVAHAPHLLAKSIDFQERWNAHWAELDRAAADLPPSMRID